MLVSNGSIRPDNKRLRHAVYAPFDCAPAIVHANGVIWIAEIAQKSARVFRPVLVVQTHDANALIVRKLHQEWMLLPARHAPRTPNIYNADLAEKIFRVDPWHPGTLQCRQL